MEYSGTLKGTLLLTFVFFIVSSTALSQTQQPLNLNLPKKMNSNWRVFGPGTTAKSTFANTPTSIVVQGEMLTVDTESKSVCEEIRKEIVYGVGLRSNEFSAENFCDGSKGRYVNVIRFDQEKERPAIFVGESSSKLGDKVKDFSVIGVGMMALIASLPRSVSKWEDNALDDPIKKWKKNVTSAPVVDSDDWAVNYIGHPYSGGAYYVVARRSGYTPMESFGFSAMMSTFWWEYGLEAAAERPSIQDLLLTPILGSLLGEAMYMLTKHIDANNGKLWNSKLMGTIGMILADPAGSIMRGINSLTRNRYIYSSQLNFGIVPKPKDPLDLNRSHGSQNYDVGVQLRMKFWGL